MTTNITVNPVQKFRALLPNGSRTYGLVASINSTTNTSRVTLQNGDEVVVRGEWANIGDRVLIVDAEIRQVVPTLPYSSITLY